MSGAFEAASIQRGVSSGGTQNGINAARMREGFFVVKNGEVTRAQRLVQGSRLGWRITVEPASDDDVTVSFAASAQCAAQGAVCTADSRPLTSAQTITVRGPAPAPAPSALTARVGAMPSEHDGSAFSFELRFSEAPRPMGARKMREEFFTVTAGAVTKAKRLEKGSAQGWRITIEPDGFDAVRVSYLWHHAA